MKSREGYVKFPEGSIPIGKQPTEFYLGIVYKELHKRNELKLISRGDLGIGKVLSILTELLSSKEVVLENNEVPIKFIEAQNSNKQIVMLPNIEAHIKNA